MEPQAKQRANELFQKGRVWGRLDEHPSYGASLGVDD